jgi:hypothetical protein
MENKTIFALLTDHLGVEWKVKGGAKARHQWLMSEILLGRQRSGRSWFKVSPGT